MAIMSMTGYGGAKGEFEGIALSIELKSVNNRHLDVSVRIPRGFIFAEEGVKARVQEHISRGKVDVFINVDSGKAGDISITVNEPLARGYIDALRMLSEKFGVRDDISASLVGRFPDVLAVEKKETDKEELEKGISAVLEEALSEFDLMRGREGQKLQEDIEGRLKAIGETLLFIERRSPETVREYREKLTLRMNEILQGAGIDEQRILQEAAIFADRVAVDEEIVRLRSHISQLRELLAQGSPAGRKLDFLVQELNREANTCGSKCGDGEIAGAVIGLKAEIEKIREQIQNIE